MSVQLKSKRATRRPISRGSRTGGSGRQALSSERALDRWWAVNQLGATAESANLETVLEFALAERERHAAWRALWALSRFDRARTVPLLLATLEGARGYRLWRAVLALSMLDRNEVVPALLEGLSSGDDWVQWEALGGLQALRPAGAAVEVGRFLNAGVPVHLRQRAVLVLGAIATPNCTPLLEKALTDSAPGVRWRASMCLRRSGPSARAVLKNRLKRESDAGVRRQINQDLKRMEKYNESFES
jgi:HEAT repeat protein